MQTAVSVDSVLFCFCSDGAPNNDISVPLLPTDLKSSKTTEPLNEVVVDDQLYYCMLCLSKVQKDKSSNISEIKSYSLSSSTDSLHNHLMTTHKIVREVSV